MSTATERKGVSGISLIIFGVFSKSKAVVHASVKVVVNFVTANLSLRVIKAVKKGLKVIIALCCALPANFQLNGVVVVQFFRIQV